MEPKRFYNPVNSGLVRDGDGWLEMRTVGKLRFESQQRELKRLEREKASAGSDDEEDDDEKQEDDEEDLEEGGGHMEDDPITATVHRAPVKKDSLYKPVVRKERVFRKQQIPKKLEAALPFKSKVGCAGHLLFIHIFLFLVLRPSHKRLQSRNITQRAVEKSQEEDEEEERFGRWCHRSCPR